jgi:hypothetical protein
MTCCPVSRRVGNVKNNDPSLIEADSLVRIRHAGSGSPEEAMNWHRWLATLLIMLALTACSQGGQAPYAPYSHEDKNDRSGDMM